MGALSFSSPLILAALATLPVVWWLLRATPPAPQQTRFPAFIILKKLKPEKETPDRTPLWLLLIRIALAAFIIIALAGPVLNAPPPSQNTGPLVLVVDDSFAAASHWKTRTDALLSAAAEAGDGERPVYLMTTAPRRSPGALEPMTAEGLRAAAQDLKPQPFPSDRAGAAERLSALAGLTDPEIRWLADGLAGPDDETFANALNDLGALSVFNDARAPKIALRALPPTQDGLAFRLERLSPTGEWQGDVIAAAGDGRELARQHALIKDSALGAEIAIDLPLALRNDVASVRVEGAASAGAVQLIDARDRRALVGLIAEPSNAGDRLLTGTHYLREALGPYAEFIEDNLDGVLEAGASVVILDDIGAIRTSDVEKLNAWIERGGVLIRFAGPILAEAAQDRAPPLLPVPLRGGGRAFGGALTWETPQKIDAFPADSPFAGLVPPDDVLIRRQVLAQPGGDTTTRSWARLEDGTPLVTGVSQGEGAIAMFHVTATPQWSDLPLSGVFVEMLRRLVFLSALGPDSEAEGEDRRYAPLLLLDGFGRFMRPTGNDQALTTEQMSEAPGPDRRPGFYGSPDAPLALNVIGADAPYEALSLPGRRIAPYEAAPPRNLAAPLFTLALLLFLFDALATLFLSGKLRPPRFAAALFVAIVVAGVTPFGSDARAQPLDAPIDKAAEDAALLTRLAYVKTGDPILDRLSAQALAGLSRELYRRTALEPGPPAGVDPDTDDLSVYPFLYWPISPTADAPSEAALANIENFLRFGGLILFDTRDDERAVGAGSTPESAGLQRVLSQLNIPPLTPVTGDHVLTRSFYLLPDGLFGRTHDNPVWVAAGASGSNDGVTPVILGGRDWAGAWAVDSLGLPVRPMGAGGERAREMAFRAGINIVMVAFTGNYKSDQVHAAILIQRLGK